MLPIVKAQVGQVVEIVGCSDSLLWYNSRIGETFKVLRVEMFLPEKQIAYWVRTGGKWNTLNYIYYEDAKII